jgi:hypothetical protein
VKFSSHGDAVELLAREDRFVQHRSLLVAVRQPAPVARVSQRETSDIRLIRQGISFCWLSHAHRLNLQMVRMGGWEAALCESVGKVVKAMMPALKSSRLAHLYD